MAIRLVEETKDHIHPLNINGKTWRLTVPQLPDTFAKSVLYRKDTCSIVKIILFRRHYAASLCNCNTTVTGHPQYFIQSFINELKMTVAVIHHSLHKEVIVQPAALPDPPSEIEAIFNRVD